MSGIFFNVLEKKEEKKKRGRCKCGKILVTVEPGGWEFISYSVTFLYN